MFGRNAQTGDYEEFQMYYPILERYHLRYSTQDGINCIPHRNIGHSKLFNGYRSFNIYIYIYIYIYIIS
uniref:Uncharacterized protein n=1 Tax=Octopus bimaculoides TaxID=37653 RepID=A0A0L8GRD9_OCTBM